MIDNRYALKRYYETAAEYDRLHETLTECRGASGDPFEAVSEELGTWEMILIKAGYRYRSAFGGVWV